MLIDFSDNTVVKDFVSKQEVLQRIAVVREQLPFSHVLRKYEIAWAGDDDHQFSCHFHGVDRKPSAHYYAKDKRMWCFACGDGGDIVWWVKKKEGCTSVVKALDLIAKNFGVGFDSTDLSQRMKMLEEIRSDSKRTLMMKNCADKVNDNLYQVRRANPSLEKRWDAIELLAFDRKTELDTAVLPYMDAVRIYREWSTWVEGLINQVLSNPHIY